MFNTYKPKRVTFEAMLATCLASALIRIAKDAVAPGRRALASWRKRTKT